MIAGSSTDQCPAGAIACRPVSVCRTKPRKEKKNTEDSYDPSVQFRDSNLKHVVFDNQKVIGLLPTTNQWTQKSGCLTFLDRHINAIGRHDAAEIGLRTKWVFTTRVQAAQTEVDGQLRWSVAFIDFDATFRSASGSTLAVTRLLVATDASFVELTPTGKVYRFPKLSQSRLQRLSILNNHSGHRLRLNG